MTTRPQLSVTPNHFATKAQVLAEIARDDLWPVTVHQGAFPAAPVHCHDTAVRIYVFTGAMWVEGGRHQAPVKAGPGSRVDIPAGAVHTVSSEGHVVTITAFPNSAAAAGLPQLPVGTED